jgi:uncharacterized protein YyaL (SSP411 family)
MSRLAETAAPKGKVIMTAAQLDQAAQRLGGLIDPVHGGIRGAPKFPNCMLLEFLWRAGERTAPPDPPAKSGEGREGARYFASVELTLDRICQGGIYDHLGGGFSRYSVDERWLVPHFEKMLYDNAQLLELLALAHGRSGNPLFKTRAQETVGWLAREMTTDGGAFSASLDADSEGEEGRFYVWSMAELEHAIGKDEAAFFAQHYDVTPEGNFEGHTILNRLARPLPNSSPHSPSKTGVNAPSPEEAREGDDERRLADLRRRLLAVREKRVRPGLDDKVLADWNGMMIAALVTAGVHFGEPSWLQMAARAFLFISAHMSKGDRLGHSWRAGRLLFPGLASDHAHMIRAALALYEATGERDYLDRALAWQAALDRHYGNPQNAGYFLTADDAEGLVVRPNALSDDATPNANAIAAQNLVRLAGFAGQHAWRDQVDRLFDGTLPIAAENLFMHVALLNALDLRLRAAEIVIAGTGARADALTAAALALPFLDRMVIRAPSADALPAAHPAAAKLAAVHEPAAFICVGETCSLPVTTPDAIAATVRSMRN